MTAEALAAADLTAADEAAARAALAAGVTIRELSSIDELTAVIGLFDEIWAPENGDSLMPVDLLRALAKSGNYAGGAFDLGSGKLLGASVGFFGPPTARELHSHIAGVVPAGLGRSVGFALKLHQRAWALRRSVAVIAWTYDPLICRNAYFNLAKLGARPAEYLPNFYGTIDDAINGGTETDRMLVRGEVAGRVGRCGARAGGRGGAVGRARRAPFYGTAVGRPGRRADAAGRGARRRRDNAHDGPGRRGAMAVGAAERARAAAGRRRAGDGIRQERLVRRLALTRRIR
jgi:hypothetical protein